MPFAYTDEELDRLYPEQPDDGRGGWSLLTTIYRLRRERDEARRVARVLARVAFCSPDYGLACRDEPELETAVAAVRAYPEVRS